MTLTGKRFAAGAVVVAVAAALFHAPFLRYLAAGLIVDEQIDNFQYIGLVESHTRPNDGRTYRMAVELQRQEPARRVLLIVSRGNRLTETGVLSSIETLCRRELETRGVKPETVDAIPSDGDDDWADARSLRRWLNARPNASIVLFSDHFHSASLRNVLNATLDPTAANRVCIRLLDNRRFDAANWWRSRTGMKAFGIEWLRRLHGWFWGQDRSGPPRRNADDYERDALRSLVGETP